MGIVVGQNTIEFSKNDKESKTPRSFNCRRYFQCPMAPDDVFQENKTNEKL